MRKLYPFQEVGADWLAQAVATEGQYMANRYLGDEMGLGKSVQAAFAAAHAGFTNVAVIAPASALDNWAREWETWGSPSCRAQFISWADRGLATGDLNPKDFNLVIVDEAHFAKNIKAKRTGLVLNFARRVGTAWLLSGTPMPNHPGELYAPIKALWPEVTAALGIKTHWDWMRRFCQFKQTKFGPMVFGAKNLEQLKPHLDRLMLRRRVSEVGLDMPPLRVDVSLLPRDWKFAHAIAKLGVDPETLEERMDREEGADGSPARLRRLLGEYKAPLIAELIEGELLAREYRKIVVLAHHRSVLDRLREGLRSFGPVGFDGDTPREQRQKAVDSFTSDPTRRVFIAQQQSAGTAINLQVAHELVLVEPSWSPGDNIQAIKRIHRIGSDQPCRARVFAVADSLDEAVMRREAAKIRMQTALDLQAA